MKKLALLALLSVAGLGVLGSAGCSGSPPPTNECTGESGDALKTCAKGKTIPGIDVSTYQGTIDWAKVKASGKAKYAFIRVSDGNNSIDGKFKSNWQNSKSNGVLRGAYQFFRPSQDPTTQANTFVAKIDDAGGLQPGDLPPVLDLETADGASSATVIAHAKTWLQVVEKKLGIKPIVYTAAFMSSTIGSGFGGWTLWVANYGVTCPTMPSGWTDWHFWQSADNGTVNGISGAVDLDQFNGSDTELQALTLQAPAPPKAPEAPPPADTPDADDQGSTLGSGTPPPAAPAPAPTNPCGP